MKLIGHLVVGELREGTDIVDDLAAVKEASGVCKIVVRTEIRRGATRLTCRSMRKRRYRAIAVGIGRHVDQDCRR